MKAEYIRLKDLEKAVSKYVFLNRSLQTGFDYGNAPIVKRVEDKIDFEIVEMEWGFLPGYIKTREDAFKFRNGYTKKSGQWQPPILTLNATSEEMLLPNKLYREAALKRRCLVLSTGFYEWRHVFPLNKRTGQPLKTAVKYPYHIGLKDREYFFMAGIYQPWQDKETGEYVETFAVVTTRANELMERVHNSKKRMPTILTDDLAWEWLFDDLSQERIAAIAAFQFPAGQMEACTIIRDFRDAIEPFTPFEYAELPPLFEPPQVEQQIRQKGLFD